MSIPFGSMPRRPDSSWRDRSYRRESRSRPEPLEPDICREGGRLSGKATLLIIAVLLALLVWLWFEYDVELFSTKDLTELNIGVSSRVVSEKAELKLESGEDVMDSNTTQQVEAESVHPINSTHVQCLDRMDGGAVEVVHLKNGFQLLITSDSVVLARKTATGAGAKVLHRAPVLSAKWCKGHPGDDAGETLFFENGQCSCGIGHHHYHCPECGKVHQVG